MEPPGHRKVRLTAAVDVTRRFIAGESPCYPLTFVGVLFYLQRYRSVLLSLPDSVQLSLAGENIADDHEELVAGITAESGG